MVRVTADGVPFPGAGGGRIMSRSSPRRCPVFSPSLLYELLSWFGFLMSAAFGNPIPEEVMIITAGIRTSQLAEDYGPWRWLILPACMVGAVVAAAQAEPPQAGRRRD